MKKSQLLVEKTIKMSSMGGMNDRGLSEISVSKVFTASKYQTKTFKAYIRTPILIPNMQLFIGGYSLNCKRDDRKNSAETGNNTISR